MKKIIRLKTRKITFDKINKQIIVQRMSQPSKRSSSSFAGYWAVGKPKKYSFSSKKGKRYIKKYI